MIKSLHFFLVFFNLAIYQGLIMKYNIAKHPLSHNTKSEDICSLASPFFIPNSFTGEPGRNIEVPNRGRFSC